MFAIWKNGIMQSQYRAKYFGCGWVHLPPTYFLWHSSSLPPPEGENTPPNFFGTEGYTEVTEVDKQGIQKCRAWTSQTS